MKIKVKKKNVLSNLVRFFGFRDLWKRLKQVENRLITFDQVDIDNYSIKS